MICGLRIRPYRWNILPIPNEWHGIPCDPDLMRDIKGIPPTFAWKKIISPLRSFGKLLNGWNGTGRWKDFFLMLEVFDPHEPFDPPFPYNEMLTPVTTDKVLFGRHTANRIYTAKKSLNKFAHSMPVKLRWLTVGWDISLIRWNIWGWWMIRWLLWQRITDIFSVNTGWSKPVVQIWEIQICIGKLRVFRWNHF